jgi:tRNA uracil 4-sulfurtransferase
MPSIIVHYQEIALKGKNRPWFLQRLVRHLRALLEDLGVREIRTPMGRIEIVLTREDCWPEIRDRLGRVFGIANFALAWRCEPEVDAMGDAVIQHLPDGPVRSFRMAVRRADKQFPVGSPEVERTIGRRVQDARGWTVNLSNPGLVIGIEIVPGQAFYHFGKLPGAGGLPMGTSGRVAVLLSGGIDSPVAAWRMMRRGCRATLIHFHSYPFLSRASQEKARDLARVLAQYQLRSCLHLVPFGELQRRVTLSVPGPLRVVVYRRLMLRIAERLARAAGAQALVTGEAVGQVASQTLENITVIASATTLPILRPLIGMDKEEITADAERLGTYRISIIPDEDCCTLFTPRHPVTRARAGQVEAAERDLPLDEMVAQAVGASTREYFYYPSTRVPRRRAHPAEDARTAPAERPATPPVG